MDFIIESRQTDAWGRGDDEPMRRESSNLRRTEILDLSETEIVSAVIQQTPMCHAADESKNNRFIRMNAVSVSDRYDV